MTENLDELGRLRSALQLARQQQDDDRATIDALRKDAEEKQREAQHRVRNILSVVRSITRRTVEEGETAEVYQLRLDGRLTSFANLQGQIGRTPDAGIDLCGLVDGELLPFGIKLNDRAHAHGYPVRLKPRPASILGLAFHELARMAIEGGASTGLDGHIEVRWKRTSDEVGFESLQIVWTETGRRAFAGPKPDPTFGREVVEQAVAFEVDGEAQLDITQDGLRCRFRLPMSCVSDIG